MQIKQKGFSRLEKQIAAIEERAKIELQLSRIPLFTQSERSKEAQERRKKKIKKNYKYFKSIYFPPETFGDGYFPDNTMQKKMHKAALQPFLHWFVGQREACKTSEMFIITCWMILTERWKFPITYSEDLTKAWQRIAAVHTILTTNPRIMHDFPCKTLSKVKKEELSLHIIGLRNKVMMRPFSEERSAKGTMEGFDRPDGMFGDDVESKSSPLHPDNVELRGGRINEAFRSLKSGSSAIMCANNEDEDCYVNELVQQMDEGKLPPHIRVHFYPAWSDNAALGYVGALCKSRYKGVKSEEELQQRMNISDDEWGGGYMMRPSKKGGRAFPAEHWTEYDELPRDVFGVNYIDPNLATKIDISDTSAFGNLLFSPSTLCYYVDNLRCLPYDDADQLLTDFLAIYFPRIIGAVGFDGNVNQEAVYTNFVEMWCKAHKKPYPYIYYRKYVVDLLIKSVQPLYKAKRILFRKGMRETAEGARAYKQITKFISKKKRGGTKKDAADFLICGVTFINDPEINFGEYGRTASDNTEGISTGKKKQRF